jgi:hypothetical protein
MSGKRKKRERGADRVLLGGQGREESQLWLMEDRPKDLTRKGIYWVATTIKISTVFNKPLNQF